MRILVDENAPVQILQMLRHLLHGHDLQHVREINWQGKKDIPLLADAASRGFHALLTKDGNQLQIPAEAAAIKKSKMHHIRYGQPQRGVVGLGLAMGAVVAAMPIVVRELAEAEGQRLVQIKGLNPGSKHRYELIDPAKSPPTYWPR